MRIPVIDTIHARAKALRACGRSGSVPNFAIDIDEVKCISTGVTVERREIDDWPASRRIVDIVYFVRVGYKSVDLESLSGRERDALEKRLQVIFAPFVGAADEILRRQQAIADEELRRLKEREEEEKAWRAKCHSAAMAIILGE